MIQQDINKIALDLREAHKDDFFSVPEDNPLGGFLQTAEETASPDSDPEQAEDPLCSPMLASDEELASFPDCLVLSAGKDSLRQETEAFAHRLMGLGVPVTGCRLPEAVHGFTVNCTEGWEKALKLHCEFFRTHYNRP